jgi:uncharacterized protein with von Willebrand factor type A (vWA) domain
MKLLKKFSAEDLTTEDKNVLIAFKVAEEARYRGVKVSTAEIVEAAKLLSIYSSLKKEMGIEDYMLIFISSYAKRSGDEEKVRNAVLNILMPGRHRESDSNMIMKDLEKLRLKFGQHLRKSQLKALLEKDAEARQAYARLKLLGLIKGGRKGEYVVSEKTARQIITDTLKRYGSLQKAFEDIIVKRIMRGSVSLISMLGSELLKYVDLHKIPLDTNLRLYKLLKRERHSRKFISKVMSDKLRSGETTSNPEEVYDILKKEHAIDKDVLSKLLEQEPKLSQRVLRDYGDVELRDVIASIAKHSPDKAAEALAAAYSLSKKEKLALQHLLKHGFNIGDFDIEMLRRTSQELSRIALATDYLIKSFTEPQMRQAYLDMARDELEKLGKELKRTNVNVAHLSLAKHYSSILKVVEEAEKDPQVALEAIVRRMKPLEALELLTSVAAVDERLRRAALRLAYIIMRQLKLKIGGPLSGKKLQAKGGYGHLDVRRAVYSFTRMNLESLVRIRRARRGRHVLVLDKSGSMRQYAVYASLAAAAIAPSVTRLVLFDSTVQVLNSVEKLPLIKLVEYIFSTQYSGYTNIVAALKEASKGLPPSKLILVSDLRQTVIEKETVSEVIRELSLKGWRIFVIAPPSVDRRTLSSIEAYARTYIVSKAEDVGKIALKILA